MVTHAFGARYEPLWAMWERDSANVSKHDQCLNVDVVILLLFFFPCQAASSCIRATAGDGSSGIRLQTPIPSSTALFPLRGKTAASATFAPRVPGQKASPVRLHSPACSFGVAA